MNKDIYYYKNIKTEFINKLNNYFNYFQIDNKKIVLDEVTNYSNSFLNEPYLNYYNVYLKISNIY